MEATRGIIRNRAYAQQIRDFSGLKFGTVTPTDIDAFIEIADQTFVFMESKFGGSVPPRGQILALERLCDAVFLAGRESILLLMSHTSREDIDFAACPVHAYRYQKEWFPLAGLGVSAFGACEAFIRATARGLIRPVCTKGSIFQAITGRPLSSTGAA